MRTGNWASLLAISMVGFVGCQMPSGLRNFSITKAKDSSVDEEAPPPMRLANEPASAKGRWGVGQRPGEDEMAPEDAPAKPSSKSPATKQVAGGGKKLTPPSQLTDLPMAPDPVVPSEEMESVAEVFKEAGPEMQALAMRQYAAAANLRQKKEREQRTNTSAPAATAGTNQAVAQASAASSGSESAGVMQAGGAASGADDSSTQPAVAFLSDDPSSDSMPGIQVPPALPAAPATPVAVVPPPPANPNPSPQANPSPAPESRATTDGVSPKAPSGAVMVAKADSSAAAQATAGNANASNAAATPPSPSNIQQASASVPRESTSSPAALPPPPATPAAAVTPAKTLDDYSTRELLDALVQRFAPREGISEDEQFRMAIRQRMVMAANQRLDDALEPVPGLSASEQQFLNKQLSAVATLLEDQGPPTRSRRYTAALPMLREAVSHLGAATGSLSLQTPIFCTDVESFGCVKRFEKDRFTSGQQVILYCEVDHFLARQTEEGFHTQLQGSYEIFDAKGVKVAEQTLPEDQQTCAHYRRDYFIAYRLYLPNHLTQGTYRLRLTMEDRIGKLYGQSETTFDITAKEAAGQP